MISDLKNKSLLQTFLGYAVPCIIGMFLTSFITIADGLFIGWKLGEKGLAAVNLTLPVLYILLGLTIMTGVGGSTLAIQSLGEKNLENVGKRFTLTLAVNLVFNLVILGCLGLFMDSIIQALNPEGDLSGYVREYLGTMAYFYLFMMMNITVGMFLRGEGKPQLAVAYSIIGNLINIVLDYVFIFCLDMGLKGAALASGLAVVVPFGLGLLHFLSGKSVFAFSKLVLDWKDIRSILFNGSSECVSQISVSITTFLMNRVLMTYLGIDGVAAFTIAGYTAFIQSMVVTGIAQGIHPLVSYHYGAGEGPVIRKLLGIAMKSAILTGVLAALASFIASSAIISAFLKSSPRILEIGVTGLRLFSLSFALNGINIIASAFFTSVGDAGKSAILSFLRSLILPCLLILLLPTFLGTAGIWLSAPITETFTLMISLFFLRRFEIGIRRRSAYQPGREVS